MTRKWYLFLFGESNTYPENNYKKDINRFYTIIFRINSCYYISSISLHINHQIPEKCFKIQIDKKTKKQYFI
ncbi:MAG: hypothetical protein CMD18_01260 [Flavobacteriales bacterium]|nr:hypothetical protein [Flavobacteriales bacterium]